MRELWPTLTANRGVKRFGWRIGGAAAPAIPSNRQGGRMPGTIGLRGGGLARGLLPGLFLFLFGLAGCASGGGDPFAQSINTDGFLLRVESSNTYEVEVYINPGGKRQLIGTVPAHGLEFLEFEYPAGQPLYVELETRLGDRYRVPGVSFPGGGRVDMVISNTLRNSGFVRRVP
jgi:hypothetical protein